VNKRLAGFKNGVLAKRFFLGKQPIAHIAAPN
jgi:hypothetical protein